MVETTCEKRTDIWNPSDDLSPRVKKLRQEYFSFNKRDFRNEVMAFTTGEPGDVLFSSIQWGVAPEVFIFAKGIQDTLTATATKVEVSDGFWKKSIAGRKAEFFAEVIRKYLPVRILDIAAGHGRYVLDAIERAGGRPDAILLRDYDDRNVAAGRRLIRSWGATPSPSETCRAHTPPWGSTGTGAPAPSPAST